jgi:hypothetical protein
MKKRRRRRRRASGPSAAARLEQRGLPIVTELARVAKSGDPPRVKLEGAMEVLFGAYGESDSDFSERFLAGWLRACQDKQFRMTLAWQREQIRLSIEDILVEGVAAGVFRAGLDAPAVAALITGVADGCLFQAAAQGGPVTTEQLLRTVLALVLSGA